MDIEDIVINILLQHPVDKLTGLCGSNKNINRICNSERFWRKIYERDNIPIPDQDMGDMTFRHHYIYYKSVFYMNLLENEHVLIIPYIMPDVDFEEIISAKHKRVLKIIDELQRWESGVLIIYLYYEVYYPYIFDVTEREYAVEELGAVAVEESSIIMYLLQFLLMLGFGIYHLNLYGPPPGIDNLLMDKDNTIKFINQVRLCE